MTKEDAESAPPERFQSGIRLRDLETAADEDDTPRLLLIATLESSLDAFAVKWALQAEGILAFLGAHSGSVPTDLYVLAKDAARALAILEREDARKTA